MLTTRFYIPVDSPDADPDDLYADTWYTIAQAIDNRKALQWRKRQLAIVPPQAEYNFMDISYTGQYILYRKTDSEGNYSVILIQRKETYEAYTVDELKGEKYGIDIKHDNIALYNVDYMAVWQPSLTRNGLDLHLISLLSLKPTRTPPVRIEHNFLGLNPKILQSHMSCHKYKPIWAHLLVYTCEDEQEITRTVLRITVSNDRQYGTFEYMLINSIQEGRRTWALHHTETNDIAASGQDTLPLLHLKKVVVSSTGTFVACHAGPNNTHRNVPCIILDTRTKKVHVLSQHVREFSDAIMSLQFSTMDGCVAITDQHQQVVFYLMQHITRQDPPQIGVYGRSSGRYLIFLNNYEYIITANLGIRHGSLIPHEEGERYTIKQTLLLSGLPLFIPIVVTYTDACLIQLSFLTAVNRGSRTREIALWPILCYHNTIEHRKLQNWLTILPYRALAVYDTSMYGGEDQRGAPLPQRRRLQPSAAMVSDFPYGVELIQNAESALILRRAAGRRRSQRAGQ